MQKTGKFKRIMCAIVATLSLGTAFGSMTACGGGGKQTFTDLVIPEGGYDGSAVTVTFYHTMGQSLTDVLNKYIPEFNKLYPNITIDHKQVGGYDDVRDQISKELTAGNQPNMSYCYPDHVALYNIAGAVCTLDDLIASDVTVTRADSTTEVLGLTDEQIADFIPGYYNEGKAFGDNKMYTLPLYKSTEVLYYDKTFFTANNLEVPETWDEMEALCAQIKTIDPTCIPLGYDSEANWFITMCEQLGSSYTSATGDHFLFDNETNRNFVAEYREWYQKGYVTTQEILGSYTSSLFTAQTGTRSYMSIGSSAGATKQCPTPNDKGEYPFEVGISTIPQVNPEAPKVISQGPSLCIFKKDNPQEVIASWLFTKYLTTTVEFQADLSMASGYVPVLQSVVDDTYYKAFLNKANGTSFIAALSAQTCMDQVEAYYVSPAFKGSSVARDEVGALMQRCFVESPELTGDAAATLIKNAFKDAVEECEYQA
ncbi:MAG: extracellular solute-binding protein [Clostridia bacterium]|nr:extracellular solute-binding protein [Clostridia bacterium]